VVRICLDNDFDPTKISKELKRYETDVKYKGLEEYEWTKVTTKDQEIAEKKAQARHERQEREK
jgi:hypothetical protein